MQQHNPSYIELIWPKDTRMKLTVYEKFNNPLLTKPIAFIWHDSHLRPASPKLIKWLQTDFKSIFKYDPLKWWASISTVSPHLQPYLKDLFNDKTIIH